MPGRKKKNMSATSVIRNVTYEMRGEPKDQIKTWGELASRGFDIIRETILIAEREMGDGKGSSKKAVVIGVLRVLIDIPFIPGKIEEAFWSLLIDLIFWAWRSGDPTKDTKDAKAKTAKATETVPAFTAVAKSIIEAAEPKPNGKPSAKPEGKAPDKLTVNYLLKIIDNIGGSGATIEQVAEVVKEAGFSPEGVGKMLMPLFGKKLELVGEGRYKVAK